MGISAVHTASAEVIAEPGRLGAANESLEPPQVLRIGRGHRAEIHRNPVLHNPVLLQNPIQHGQRAAGIDHKVF